MKRFSVTALFLLIIIFTACGQGFENTTWSFSVISLDGKATITGEMVFYKESLFINGTPHAYYTQDGMIFIDDLGYTIKEIDDDNLEFIPAFGGERYIVKLKRKA